MRGGWIAIVLVAAAGCGGSDATPDATKTIDARKTDAGDDHRDSGIDAEHVDAAPATVKKVSCTGAVIAATVTTPNDGLAYSSNPAGSASNDSAITVGGIVEFQPGAEHPVGPDAASGMTDSGLVAQDSATTCLQFTVAGTFHYKCTIHGFKGTVTVSQ